MNIRKITALLLLVNLFSSQTAHAQKEKGLETITLSSIQAQTVYLASDLMRGREAGTSDAARTAEYLASQFCSLGLTPYVKNAEGILERYMQPFAAVRASEFSSRLSIQNDAGVSIAFTEGIDYQISGKPTFNGVLSGKAVAYDSLADHRGQFVYYQGTPSEQTVSKLKVQGAIALFVYDSLFWEQNTEKKAFQYHYNEPIYEGFSPRETFSDTKLVPDGTSRIPFVQIQISKEILFLLKKSCCDITLPLSCKRERVFLRNVLGVLKGEKNDEYVVIGSHFDHLGIQNGYIYNGADDNASGTVAVLQIAKAFVASGIKPQRTVIFALWDGEEYGLLGSRYFTRTCDILNQIKGYMNFDMIGRNHDENVPESVVFFYTANYPKYEQWMKKYIRHYNLSLKPIYKPWDNPVGGSDNASFAEHGIPIVWYHTDGHPDYHQPGDHAEKINWSKMIDIIRSAYLIFFDMAQEENE